MLIEGVQGKIALVMLRGTTVRFVVSFLINDQPRRGRFHRGRSSIELCAVSKADFRLDFSGKRSLVRIEILSEGDKRRIVM